MSKETLRISPKEISPPQESNSQEPKPAKNFNNTLEFWGEIIAQGARLKKPKGVLSSHWRRNIRITKLYLFQQHLNHERIGKNYRITRERIRQIVKGTTVLVWDNSSPEIQNRHPKEGFSFRKPDSLETSIRHSIGHGGKTAIIRKELLAGYSLREIQKRHKFTGDQITNSRHILKMWGIELPHLNNQPSSPQGKELVREIRKANDYETTQSLLDKVSKGFLYRESRGDDPLLVSLNTVAKECGIRTKSLDTFTLFLKSRKIAVGKTPPHRETYPYYFIRIDDEPEVKKLLQREKFPIATLA